VHAKLQLKVAGESSGFILSTANPPTATNGEECMAYDAAWNIPEDDSYVTEGEAMDINDILDGTTELNFSHAGGIFQHIVEEELHQQSL